MAKLGDVMLFIEKESGSHKIEATMYPVEKGEPFTDHVAKRPSEFGLDGYIFSENWQSELSKLVDMMNNGKIVKYVGKTTANDVIILDVQEDHDQEVANGVAISISLRKIRITQTAWQQAPPQQVPARKPTTQSGQKKPVTATASTSGVFHVVKKGDTYWGLSKKYGSTIAQLRSWNKYPDRQIPIGVKLRVK